MMRVLMIVFAFLFVSCSLRIQKGSQDHVELENKDLSEAQALLTKAQYTDAVKAFQDFKRTYGYSIYLLEAKLGEAQAHLGLENHTEALALSREVTLSTRSLNSQLKARGLYQMALAYESLGEEHKALASLLDAYTLRSSLPIHVGEAEIPARLSALYGKFGQEAEAARYLKIAEKGLKDSLEKGALEKTWLGQTYFQMGDVSLNHLSEGNFSTSIEGIRWVQGYLIKALKLNDFVWSQKSEEKLKQIYLGLYKVASNTENRSQQTQYLGDVLELIQQAELYKALSEHKLVPYEERFYSFLAEMRNQCEKLIYERGTDLDLTEAAKERNSLKRFPRQPRSRPQEVKSEKTISEKPGAVDIGEDPNL